MTTDQTGPPVDSGMQINSCDDVLSHVFEFLDHETNDERRAVIAEHLEDCSPCLREFGIEAEFKALVRRRCGGDQPPPGLRDRIKMHLSTVSFEEDGTQVSVERVQVERTSGDRVSVERVSIEKVSTQQVSTQQVRGDGPGVRPTA